MKMRIVFGVWLMLALFLAPVISQARYLNVESGRFWTMDTYPGINEEPLSLHKYFYCQNNPVNNTDPSGHEVEGMLAVMNISFSFFAQISPAISRAFGEAVAIERQPASTFR